MFGGFCSGRFLLSGVYTSYEGLQQTIYGGLRTIVGLVLRGFLFPNNRRTGAT